MFLGRPGLFQGPAFFLPKGLGRILILFKFDGMKSVSTKLTLLLLLCSPLLQAQELYFSKLSIAEGLSQYTVRDIVQDGRGLVWLATDDGLNRFDGNDVRIFRHDPADSASIGSNHLRSLALGSDGKIWCAASHYLSAYRPEDGKFENHRAPGSVNCVLEAAPGLILAGLDSSLSVYDTDSDTWTVCKDSLNVSCLFKASDCLYVGTYGGEVYQMAGGTLLCRKIPGRHSGKSIQAIYSLSQDELWLATEGDGLLKISTDGAVLQRYNSHSGLSSDYVRSLCSDSSGRLWVGTVNGLDIIRDGRIEHHQSDPFRNGALSHNSVRCITRDEQNGMWLGTYYGGASYWNPLRNHFGNIVRQQDGKSLSDNILSCIVEDGDYLWTGTNGGGVNRIKLPQMEVEVISTNISESDVVANDVKAICAASGYVYVGAHAGGLRRIRRSDSKVTVCGGGKGPRDVYSLLALGRDSLLVGSLEGLYIYDCKSDSFTDDGAELQSGRIWSLAMDASGRLWAGTDSGVRVWEITDGGLRECSDMSSRLAGLSRPVCIYMSSGGPVWIATRDGAYSYDDDSGTLTRYGVAEGLAGNVTHGIEEDGWGRLWISTDHGLSCLNPFTGQVRNYTVSDGLSTEQFNDYSHCRRANGEMWFGGMTGATFFSPAKFSSNPYSPQPCITGLEVAGESVYVNGEALEFPHNRNTLSISFSVPDYLSWGGSRFKYMLEGQDEDWQEAGTERKAVYSELPAGKYVFKLLSANNDGVWTTEPEELEIRIKPVWYKTPLARALGAVLLLAILIFIWLFARERSRMHQKIRQEEEEIKRQEELGQMKTRFFINLSHELRNPLQLILAPIEQMQKHTDDRWMRKQLRYLDRNANRLLHLVNQLMDYRRAELGVFKLHVREEDVHKLLKENFAYFENIAASKHLAYTFSSEIEGLRLLCDDQYLELILNNLLSNAFKYTESGSVKVRAWLEGERLLISVADTGKGVAPEEREKIFERFYQADNAQMGSGIGLSLVQKLVELHHGSISLESEEGKYSVFTVSLPVSPEAYSAEELSGGKEEKHSVNTAALIAKNSGELGEKEAVDVGKERPRLLIAEDDPEIRTYLEQGLEKNFLIQTAGNGKEALEKLSEAKFDVLVADYHMPVMNGRDLCRNVRKNPDWADIPIIAISSMSAESSQLEMLYSGADDYVTKPFSVQVLAAKLNKLLKSKRKAQRDSPQSALSSNPADEDFLNRALSHIEANISNADYSTEDLAADLHMSRSNLHLKLKAITGSSALELIRKVRFEKACEMLRDGRWSVSEIADRVGFSSASYFTTSFKKRMGCLPSEYSKSLDKS